MARMFPQESSDSKHKFYMVKSSDKSDLAFEYKAKCISERDLSDYFKYMLQGNLEVTLMSAKTNKRLATAVLPKLHSSLRQGKEV
jgi:hypothetical protein